MNHLRAARDAAGRTASSFSDLLHSTGLPNILGSSTESTSIPPVEREPRSPLPNRDTIPTASGTSAALTSPRTGTDQPANADRAVDLSEHIRTLLSAPRLDRFAEQDIITRLAAATPESLNATLRDIDLASLLRRTDNHSAAGADNHTRLVQLLASERVDHLDMHNRADLLYALQVGPTNDFKQQQLANILQHTSGAQLTDLKLTLDSKNNHYDLHHLVFSEISDSSLRQAVLDHISAQHDASAPAIGLRVISDIDDTLIAKLNDKRYPNDTRYPGVLAFHTALNAKAAAQTSATMPVVFLTARPEDPMGGFEDYTHHHLSELGVGSHNILCGDLISLRSSAAMAKRKMQNFKELSAVYPEYSFVFIGDNGQGDPAVGQAMVTEHAATVPAVFMHDIKGSVSPEERQALAAQNTFVFDSYAGAATAAAHMGLITAEQLSAVAKITLLEVKALKTSTAPAHKQQVQQTLMDIEQAMKFSDATGTTVL